MSDVFEIPNDCVAFSHSTHNSIDKESELMGILAACTYFADSQFASSGVTIALPAADISQAWWNSPPCLFLHAVSI